MIELPLRWLRPLVRAAVFGFIVWAGAASVVAETGPVESFEELDMAPFERSIRQAAADGAPWVEDPLQMALAFVGPFEGRSQSITRRNDSSEAPGHVEIIVVEDGYLDDSVRGAWYRLLFVRDSRGAWTIEAAYRAWRCWPRRGHDSFSKEPCL